MNLEPIKVVYNWIGPTGPMINTEVPSVLDLSKQVMSSDVVMEKNYFHERLWLSLFNNAETFQLTSAFELISGDAKATFIYPLQMDWRLHYAPYFMSKQGILEFSRCHQQVIDWVRNGNGYFLLDLSHESFVSDHELSIMESYFITLSIPLDKIIYVTGCPNARLIQERRMKTYNRSIHVVTYPAGVHSAHAEIKNKPLCTRSNLIPSKLFLSWNRRFRIHRTVMALLMLKHKLLDLTYLSMPMTDPTGTPITFNTHCEEILWIIKLFDITDEEVAKFNLMVPLELDNPPEIFDAVNNIESNRRYYEDSLISIVTETKCDHEIVSLTEKTTKPIQNMHPFIIVGSPGSLLALRELGFRTFNAFWDEGYDCARDYVTRIKMIISVCNDIAAWDDEKKAKFIKDSEEIVQHNYRILQKNPNLSTVKRIVEIVS
jgi:hypothetical protein